MRKKPKALGYHFDAKHAYIHPANGKPSCRWCRGQVFPPKQNWCPSPKCLEEWLFRTRNSYFRQVIYDRDRGICAACGVDTNDFDLGRLSKQRYYAERIEATAGDKRELWRRWSPRVEVVIVRGVGVPYPSDYWKDLYDRAMTWRAVNNVKPWEPPWQVDHKHPVIDGCDYFDKSNLFSMCVPCHRAKTSKENRERAAHRRSGKSSGGASSL